MADPVEDLLPLIPNHQNQDSDSDSQSSNNELSDDASISTDSDVDEEDNEVEVQGDNEEGDLEAEARPRRWLRKFGKMKKKKDAKRKSSDGDESQLIINFDKSLPGTHSYLGNDLVDLRGRTILEENSIMTLPMIMMPDIILVPGQLIPLQLYVPRIVAMVRRAADTNKTFGVLNVRHNHTDTDNPTTHHSDIGCTAEILSWKYEEDERSGISMIRAKARGRQRFRVIGSLITEITGEVQAKVLILPELSFSHILNGAQLGSMKKFLIPPSEDRNVMIKTAVDRQGQILTSVDLRSKRPFDKLFAAHFTSWPPWVYKVYDIEWLCQQMAMEIKSWCPSNIPKDATELSYWVGHNLPVEDKTRIRLLSFDSVVQRLRYGLSVLRKSGVVLCCRYCHRTVSGRKKVFSMTQEGPLGTFVNPGGFVHEMFTVLGVTNMTNIGGPSTEQSWFPGYAWTIIQCKSCHHHMGWMFTGTQRNLSPHTFWGLCRSSVRTVFTEGDGDVGEMTDDDPTFVA